MGKGALGQAMPQVVGYLTASVWYWPSGPGTVGALWVAATPRGLAARRSKYNDAKIFGPKFVERRHPGNENLDGKDKF